MMRNGPEQRTTVRQESTVDTIGNRARTFSLLTSLLHAEDPALAKTLRPTGVGNTLEMAKRVEALGEQTRSMPTGIDANLDNARVLAQYFVESLGGKVEFPSQNGHAH